MIIPLMIKIIQRTVKHSKRATSSEFTISCEPFRRESEQVISMLVKIRIKRRCCENYFRDIRGKGPISS